MARGNEKDSHSSRLFAKREQEHIHRISVRREHIHKGICAEIIVLTSDSRAKVRSLQNPMYVLNLPRK